MSAAPGIVATLDPAAALALVGGGAAFGLAHAAHCAGMCGAFALHAAGGRGAARAFSTYAVGKTFSYVFLGAAGGAVGGAAGALATSAAGAALPARAILGALVGAALVVAGWRVWRARPVQAGGPGPGNDALGRGRRVAAGAGGGAGALAQALARLIGPLRRPDLPGGRFTLGALTGLLPCGAVYLAALQALALGDAARGAAFMASFGLGTVPALAAVAWGGRRLLPRLGTARLRAVAGAVVVAAGLVTLARSLAPLLLQQTPGACAGCVF